MNRFLWDNQTYLLGRQPDDKKEGFGRERFEAFRKRHLEVEKKDDVEVPRSFADYEVPIDESAIPDGVTLIRRI